jgi:hypothetical protein
MEKRIELERRGKTPDQVKKRKEKKRAIRKGGQKKWAISVLTIVASLHSDLCGLIITQKVRSCRPQTAIQFGKLK